ncbi:Hpt domain-containing protein [Desulfoluna spongiiphila]|uniref:HPt (Histidine-containing phosphotransfer) domain-containing protein n=1 Tax=Desulfoluna spongiiphila TaxID=419481 RepID=A0A1G5I3I6_9BACT|nr:Hpt domain-containing protein [Desulfoluna spongiiphila]SCY70616.1 HPt (histidine-containing phosphotransfer) domain-containing protein [Desulfoluna spongiiphila]
MDLKAIGEDLGLEESEFLEIVELFLETAETDITRLKEAIARGDMQTLTEAAHSLKGSAGNLGFTEIYRLSKDIETAARENTLDRLGPVLESIDALKGDIQDALNAKTA